jgi:signal transduction histidine kinase
MNALAFLKDKIGFLLIHSVVIIFTGVFLSAFQINLYAISFLILIYLISLITSLLLEYIPKRVYYQNVGKNLENLDKKYLLSELIDEPLFTEGRILYDCLQTTNKSMNDEIAKYSISSKEYREYIELWIHEVKTPIASSKLIMENNPSDITKSLSEELDTVDYYLEQALFYSRSNGVEKDYIIKETSLKDLVNSVIRRNSKAFIQDQIKLTIETIDYSVNTDTKWLEFILNQIIVNAIKYHGENPSIRIYVKELEHNISLYVEDNGIGISEKDIPMVFEKGYTGKTGRQYAKSTGIGLYLCKKLCNKLGLSIQIYSLETIGTTLTIIFPKTNFMSVY